MYTRVAKTEKNKSKAFANPVSQRKSNVKQGFGYVDNRPESITQRKLQEMVNNSAQDRESQKSDKTVLQREKVTLEQGESVGKVVYSSDGKIKGKAKTYKGIVLVDISVPKGERKKGYGTQLMNKFMKDIVGSKPCYLDVIAHNKGDEVGLSNDDLEKWYGKFGFTSLGKSGWGDNTIMGVNYPLVDYSSDSD